MKTQILYCLSYLPLAASAEQGRKNETVEPMPMIFLLKTQTL